MATPMLSTQRAAVLDMVTDAKAHRDAQGIVDPRLDAQYARVTSGDFSGLVAGETTQKAGRDIIGMKAAPGMVGGKDVAYARPGKGGDGTYSPTTQPKRTGNGATPKMVNYIRVLLDQRQHNYGEGHPIFAALVNGLSFDMARKTIEFLKAQPYKLPSQRSESAPEAAPVAPKRNAWQEWRELATPLLPFERFAVTGKDGKTKFYRIFEYTRERDNAKFIICRVVSGASGESGHWSERLAPEIMVSIAKQIHADGIKAAALRYGAETGRCCDCNRLLTDPVSKANGIGPICAAKPHWS